MAYNYEYPYTDSGRYNDDWLIGKVKEVSEAQERLEERQDTLETFVETQEETLEARLEPIAEDYIDSMIEAGAFYNKGAGAHNGIYRGKNLGTSVTLDQWAAIQSGDFDDLFIGDYWVINGVTWRIAGFDYYLNMGDTNTTTHHIVILPDSRLYTSGLNTENSNEGGYAAVKTRGVLDDAETAIQSAFGASHILSHRIYISTAINDGKVTTGAWADTICDLPNEIMVFGCPIYSAMNSGTTFPINRTVETSQLPLFTLDHSKISNRQPYWFRDPIINARFANVDSSGFADQSNASVALGIRPVFCIK